ncbi:hypothetical protein M6B38_111245 [Iris pallida]|uniref:Uncharacterized protein n=1 Tax=Iris pallida TaxID=29817 RepID=A0AAX6DN51_IRIPA|nr:hypothetical protein M6B38_111245 [Iris pallida]
MHGSGKRRWTAERCKRTRRLDPAVGRACGGQVSDSTPLTLFQWWIRMARCSATPSRTTVDPMADPIWRVAVPRVCLRVGAGQVLTRSRKIHRRRAQACDGEDTAAQIW